VLCGGWPQVRTQELKRLRLVAEGYPQPYLQDCNLIFKDARRFVKIDIFYYPSESFDWTVGGKGSSLKTSDNKKFALTFLKRLWVGYFSSQPVSYQRSSILAAHDPRDRLSPSILGQFALTPAFNRTQP
jgi:hypothetical protein